MEACIDRAGRPFWPTNSATEPKKYLFSTALGIVIKAERSRQNISMDDLSRICGVSKGMLSQIERGKTNPTVAVLYKIASGLRTDPTSLLPLPTGKPRIWRVILANDERYVFSTNKMCRIRTLSPLDLEKQIEFYEITFAPNGELVSEPHFLGTEEILTVAQGRLKVRAGEKETVVRRGDSVHYAADIAHRITNLSKHASVVLLIVRYRT
ncbi:MAG: XRE family transcriptional regulator [Verrucomicrobiota bacterium]